jgi:AraC-like DNA-binding protein
MSPFHLNRVVREITGLPPVALTALRLQEAKRLLLTTDASSRTPASPSASPAWARSAAASPPRSARPPPTSSGHPRWLTVTPTS